MFNDISVKGICEERTACLRQIVYIRSSRLFEVEMALLSLA